jgi:hypothetical protein
MLVPQGVTSGELVEEELGEVHSPNLSPLDEQMRVLAEVAIIAFIEHKPSCVGWSLNKQLS